MPQLDEARMWSTGNGGGILVDGNAAADTSCGGLPEETKADELLANDTPETAARHCELFCALCTKHHALLRDLYIVFGECKGLGRAAIMRNAEGLARVLGASAPALIALIDDTPQGSTNLLLRMLNFLTERQAPPQVLYHYNHFLPCKSVWKVPHIAILSPYSSSAPREQSLFLQMMTNKSSILLSALLDRKTLENGKWGSHICSLALGIGGSMQAKVWEHRQPKSADPCSCWPHSGGDCGSATQAAGPPAPLWGGSSTHSATSCSRFDYGTF